MARLIDKLHPLERRLLPHLSQEGSFEDLANNASMQKVEVMRALQWLENKGILRLSESEEDIVNLGPIGARCRKKGLPERLLLDSLVDGMLLSEARESAGLERDEVNVAIGVLKKRAAISIEKSGNELRLKLTEQGRRMKDREFVEEKFLPRSFPFSPGELGEEERFAFAELRKRKGIIRVDRQKSKSYKLTEEGRKLLREKIDEEYIERLTPAIIKSGLWKKRKFRSYDVEINVPKISGGKRHFVEQAIRQIKRIWLDLGFVEMKGNLVQTGFWDLDALFVPQDHPARDEQDTFYIEDPKYGKLPKLADKVKKTHENGWKTGSRGWRYKWSEDIARENMLRTHTTVLSAQAIAGLREEDLPAKFFSVKQVYRNETLSWKHLFEFIQIEGIVVDPGANFSNLIGYLKDFFAKLGFPDARVRPGHFPYTEPSAEVDVWHPGKKTWVELGGSGIFRPEVVQPLIGKPVPVCAWGLGLERSIMEYYRMTDIRNVYRNDLKMLREMRAWMR